MDIIQGGYMSGWSAADMVGSPSITHMIALVALVALWKFPKSIEAFDPKPSSQSSSHNVPTNPLFTPPPPPPKMTAPPPPLARRLSSGSSCSDDASEQSSVESVSEPKHGPEPSSFLRSKAPESTPAERQRFLTARKGDEAKALENLQKYLSWRKQYQEMVQEQEEKHYNLQFEDPDLYDWIVASQAALQAENDAAFGWKWLPRLILTHKLPNGQEAQDLNGRRIFHMMPAQIDDQICNLSTYSLAIALYLDRKIQRDSLEKVTIAMDLRPGRGWRNTSAVKLLPFIKSIVGLLLVNFPERLSKAVLYPLPFAFSWVFSAVKAVIDPDTAEKLQVLSGSAGVDSPLPLNKLTRFMGQDVALLCEHGRQESFSA
ncbi:expressed unknown protein [Seminavis robusta]|uniref:CRAL-TRIO domain-containing protein n=1 Tax=Seminavis robusta TaxID=568900 RepID=A0A9N8HLK7_9STRA|nr:expressed unknown protein [Seminavis robusta]|eukprot:Sro1039_g234390.1 n/a (373) ;mRNA; f:20755-21873